MLNFFAMWCPYCLSELKTLNKIYPDYKDITFISIAVDKQGNPVKYIHDQKYPWIFGFSDRAVSLYDAETIPVTVFIHKDKTTEFRNVGELQRNEIISKLNKIRE